MTDKQPTPEEKRERVRQNARKTLENSFFQDVLGIPTELALADACKMEHLMSLETGQRMMKFMRLIINDKIWTEKIKRALAHPVKFHDKPVPKQKSKSQKVLTFKRLKHLDNH